MNEQRSLAEPSPVKGLPAESRLLAGALGIKTRRTRPCHLIASNPQTKNDSTH